MLKVYLKEGRVVRLETDDGEEPQLRACLRCRAYRQRLYDHQRLRTPLKRTGRRGEGKFEPLSWEEALDMVVCELRRIRENYGPAAVLFLGGGGDLTELHRYDLIQELLAMTGGLTKRWGVPSFEGGLFASLATYGTLSSGNDFDDLLNSRLILLWGVDPATTINETNTMWYLLQAKEKGIKIICVDPRFTDTAAVLADRWIPIYPGTDTALLLAMAHVIIKEGLQDQKFIDTYTVGFEVFRDYLMGREDGIEKTPAWASEITGVSPETIREMALLYGKTKPAALIAGVAPGRTAYGEQYHRAAKILAVITGNVGIHGGWAGRSFIPSQVMGGFDFKLGQMPKSAGNPVEEGVPTRKDALMTKHGSASRARIHFSEIAEAILKGKAGGYPADIKMVFVMQTNPINQYPNTNKMVQAFEALEFVVVAEQVMSATARYADILLPVSTYMERNDLTFGGATPTCGFVRKVVEPLDEAKSPFEIACLLAQKLGLSLYQEKTEEEWLKVMVEKSPLLPDYETLKENTIFRITREETRVAFKEQIEDPVGHPFPTPSGKIEIYSGLLASMENPHIPPIPKYMECWEGRQDPLRKRYPLQLISSHFRGRAHTQFANVPWLKEAVEFRLMMNPKDAELRGIKDGDKVLVFNDRGRVLIDVWVTERIVPGVVDLPEGAWYNPDENGIDTGGCVNCLTKDTRSPAGAGTFNTCLVEVKKAK